MRLIANSIDLANDSMVCHYLTCDDHNLSIVSIASSSILIVISYVLSTLSISPIPLPDSTGMTQVSKFFLQLSYRSNQFVSFIDSLILRPAPTAFYCPIPLWSYCAMPRRYRADTAI